MSKFPHGPPTQTSRVHPVPSTGASTGLAGRAPRDGKILGGSFKLENLLRDEDGIQVHEGRDLASGDSVTVRILMSARAAEQRRFAETMPRVARLVHPCIAQVLHHGLVDGAPCYVTPPDNGLTVAAALKK